MERSGSPQLIALSPEQLQLGATLRVTLRDEKGQVLLAQGKSIDSLHLLDALRTRSAVYVAARDAAETTKVLMQGLVALDHQGAPIKDIDRYVLENAQPDKPKAIDPLSGNLLAMYNEVEARLRVILARVAQGADSKTGSVASQLTIVYSNLEQLIAHDRDGLVLLLMHRAVVGHQGYSVLHSFQCALLAYLVAPILKLPTNELEALVYAALTMNVAMTTLQDVLTSQKSPPSPIQRQQIDNHPRESAKQLHAAGISNRLWLEVVAHHHAEQPSSTPLAERSPAARLVRILQVLDRYTAAMSPRASRAGRDAANATRSAVVQSGASNHDEVGLALLQVLGLYPAGGFVQLESEEIALTLRRGDKPNQPIVATVFNKRGEPVSEPRLYSTAQKGLAVKQAVPSSNIKIRPQMEQMLKLLAFSRTPAAARQFAQFMR